jgi:hypothetical protein
VVVRNLPANRESDEARWTLVRRFFLYENATTDGEVVQYAEKLSIVFEVNRRNHEAILVPYIEIQYAQVTAALIGAQEEQVVVDYDHETAALRPFTFTVMYTMDLGQFWSAVLYLFIVFLILTLTYFTVHTFLYLKSYGGGGIDASVIIAFVTDLADTVLLSLRVHMELYHRHVNAPDQRFRHNHACPDPVDVAEDLLGRTKTRLSHKRRVLHYL